MSTDLKIVERVGYSLLDLLSEVGGLNRALNLLLKIAMIGLSSFLGIPKIDAFLSTVLYNIDVDNPDSDTVNKMPET